MPYIDETEFRNREIELERLIAVWPRLPRRIQDSILLAAGVLDARAPGSPPSSKKHRTPQGQTPDWLVLALNLLKDSNGYLPDMEIAERAGVSPSTLSRNAAYQNARRTYYEKPRRVVRQAPGRRP